MGLSFDTNGKYLGWSNLFNYNSIEELEASEKLPMPKNVKHMYISDIGQATMKLRNALQNAIESENIEDQEKFQLYLEKIQDTVDIEEDINKIEKEVNNVKRINLYANLLNKLNKHIYYDDGQKTVNVTFKNLYGKEVLKKLQQHETTKIPQALAQEVSKNFISSHIQNTVQDLTNMTRAYSPIEMEVFREASNLSDKGNQSSKLTLLDPFCKFIMQYQNMTGKNVISISANGEKGSFMWHYYLNDLIKHGTKEQREMGHFKFETNRIVNRALEKLGLGTVQPTTITGLPDLNMEGISPEIQAEFGQRITGNLYVDLMISQVLSAATDNAKELILAKVNAGSKLAKMYLFMITTGFNINDIVAFMTSPVAEFIDKVTEQDVFNDINLSIKQGIELAQGKFLNKNGTFKSSWLKQLNDNHIKLEMIKDLYLKLGLGTINDPKNPLTEEEKAILDQKQNLINQDIEEFQNILEGADEFSNFTTLLSLNQGIKTSKMDLQKFENRVKQMFNERLENYEGKFTEEEKAMIDEIGDFDVRIWFKDSEYRQKVTKIYNKIKKCINIFDAFTHIPQFDAIREIYDTVCVFDQYSAIKASAFNEIISELTKASSKSKYLSERYQNNILKQIDNCIISKYIQESNIVIPIKKGWKFLQSDASFSKFVKNGDYQIKDRASIATFKYLMESVIIPGLKRGEVTRISDKGVVTTEKIPSLQDNNFIVSLKPTTEQNIPFYKCDLNMQTIDQSLDSQRRYQKMVAGLRSMNSIQINKNMTLTDMFMLYNLIIHKNQYGASRMTTLFDPIVSSNNGSFLSNYLKWLGELDYFGKPHLNINETPNASQLLELNLEDILRQSAPIVKNETSQTDPYIIKLEDDKTPSLYKNTGGKGEYAKVDYTLVRNNGESQNSFIERTQNNSKYFTLGGQYSDLIERQLNIIQKLDNPEKVISCLNNFVKQGLLLIKKVCE